MGVEFNGCLGACEAGTRPQGRRRTLYKPLMGSHLLHLSTFPTCSLRTPSPSNLCKSVTPFCVGLGEGTERPHVVLQTHSASYVSIWATFKTTPKRTKIYQRFVSKGVCTPARRLLNHRLSLCLYEDSLMRRVEDSPINI